MKSEGVSEVGSVVGNSTGNGRPGSAVKLAETFEKSHKKLEDKFQRFSSDIQNKLNNIMDMMERVFENNGMHGFEEIKAHYEPPHRNRLDSTNSAFTEGTSGFSSGRDSARIRLNSGDSGNSENDSKSCKQSKAINKAANSGNASPENSTHNPSPSGILRKKSYDANAAAALGAPIVAKKKYSFSHPVVTAIHDIPASSNTTSSADRSTPGELGREISKLSVDSEISEQHDTSNPRDGSDEDSDESEPEGQSGSHSTVSPTAAPMQQASNTAATTAGVSDERRNSQSSQIDEMSQEKAPMEFRVKPMGSPSNVGMASKKINPVMSNPGELQGPKITALAPIAPNRLVKLKSIQDFKEAQNSRMKSISNLNIEGSKKH